MGVPHIAAMREGISQVKALPFPTIGTLTIDNFTRCGRIDDARKSLMRGDFLNGFPLLCYTPEEVIAHLTSLIDDTFMLQVRHGTPKPQALFEQMTRCHLTHTEGGPVSYCLPYSASTSLSDAVRAWEEGCHILSAHPEAHIESFGGCLMGQMCHPALLVAVAILEAIFFERSGITSLSVSYAQQYSLTQDVAALKALHRLANAFLSPAVKWHSVIYTFMGLFPLTPQGHAALLRDSVWLARLGGARRLIVKTAQEAYGLPRISSNLDALGLAGRFSKEPIPCFKTDLAEEEKIFTQAKTLIEHTLNFHENIGQALQIAFKKGTLDIPFCMHPDNRRETFCEIDARGYLQWHKTGKMPIAPCKTLPQAANKNHVSAQSFLEMLSFNRLQYDSV